MDAIDRKILQELQADSRLTNVELSQRVGLSPSPCLARVRALEQSGVITRHVALVAPEALGLSINVFIQITLERQVEKNLSAFEERMRQLPQVMECYLMTGDADYLIRVLVADMQVLQDFIVNTLSRIPGVANIKSSFALKQAKYTTALPLI